MSTLTQFSVKTGPTRVLQSYTSALSLTANSAGYQILLNPSTNRSTVTLPNATTLTVGGDKFFLENATTNDVYVRAADGQFIAALQSQGKVTLHLANNSTSGGVWSGSDGYNLSGFIADTPATAVTVNSSFAFEGAVAVCKVDTNKAIVAYGENVSSTARVYARLLTISGNTVSVGSAVLIHNSGYNGNPSSVALAQLDTNVAAIAFESVAAGPTYNRYVARLSVSGSTLSTSSVADVWDIGSYGYINDIIGLTANTFAISYDYSSTGSTYDSYISSYSWNGSSIALANNVYFTPENASTSKNDYVKFSRASNTNFISVQQFAGTSNFKYLVYKYTVSGNTITRDSYTFPSFSAYREDVQTSYVYNCVGFSSNTAVLTYIDIQNTIRPYYLRHHLMDISSTPKKNSSWGYDTRSVSYENVYQGYMINQAIDSERALMLSYNYGYSQCFYVAGIKVKANNIIHYSGDNTFTDINLNNSGNPLLYGNKRLAVVSDNQTDFGKALFVYRSSASYPTVKLINFKFPQVTES